MKDSKQLANVIRYIARSVLIIITTFWFVFALLSGSESFGGGFWGIVQNSPNALPWVLLYGLVYVSWKWEHIGGAIIVVAGLFTVYFFQTYENLFTFLFISLPLTLLGAMLITSWGLRRRKAI